MIALADSLADQGNTHCLPWSTHPMMLSISIGCSVPSEKSITNRKAPAEATRFVEIAKGALFVVELSHVPAEEFVLPMMTSAGLWKVADQAYGSIRMHCSRLLCTFYVHFRHQKRNPETLDLAGNQDGYMEGAFL